MENENKKKYYIEDNHVYCRTNNPAVKRRVTNIVNELNGVNQQKGNLKRLVDMLNEKIKKGEKDE